MYITWNDQVKASVSMSAHDKEKVCCLGAKKITVAPCVLGALLLGLSFGAVLYVGRCDNRLINQGITHHACVSDILGGKDWWCEWLKIF